MNLQFFQNAFPAVRESRLQILASAIVFAIAIPVGYFVPDRFTGSVQYLAELAAYLKDQSVFVIILLLFFKNFMASFIVLWTGTLLGIVPVAAAAQNGYLVGAVLSLRGAPIMGFINLLPHGIFELPAFFLACGMGLWRGLWLFRRDPEETYRSRAVKSYIVLYRLIVPLLIVAAIIEGVRIAAAAP
jgi:stage II sporulation protein M